MRVLISGGGTGGHVYPALAVAEKLKQAARSSRPDEPRVDQRPELAAKADQPQAGQQAAGVEFRQNGRQQPAGQPPVDSQAGESAAILWVGSLDGMEEALVTRAGLDYQGINTGQIRGINPVRAVSNVGRMAVGVRESLALVREWQPDVCLVTGGYVCAPLALACRLRQVPVLIYLPDMTPGASIRSLSRLATRVAVTFPEVAPYFGGEVPTGKAVVTGYPVREALIELAQDRRSSRQSLAERLNRPLAGTDEPPLVLIFGGSQGSRSINEATWAALPDLLPHAHVLHVVGERDWPMYNEYAAANPLQAYIDRYHPVDYLHDEMTLALAAADLAVARAGASTLGEFPIAGLPSILVPLPHAGVNQQANAKLLSAYGAAVTVEDEKLAEELSPTLIGLLQDDERRNKMATAASELANPDATERIVEAMAAISKTRDLAF